MCVMLPLCLVPARYLCFCGASRPFLITKKKRGKYKRSGNEPTHRDIYAGAPSPSERLPLLITTLSSYTYSTVIGTCSQSPTSYSQSNVAAVPSSSNHPHTRLCHGYGIIDNVIVHSTGDPELSRERTATVPVPGNPDGRTCTPRTYGPRGPGGPTAPAPGPLPASDRRRRRRRQQGGDRGTTSYAPKSDGLGKSDHVVDRCDGTGLICDSC
jgi:hypothetical protein